MSESETGREPGRPTGRSSISNASSYEEMGEYWDTHDLTEVEQQAEIVEVEACFSRRHRITVAEEVYEWLRLESARQGVQPETLANLWLMERLQLAQREPGETVQR